MHQGFLPVVVPGWCEGGHGWQYALEAADGCWWGGRACTPHPCPPGPPLPGCCCGAALPVMALETACRRWHVQCPHQQLCLVVCMSSAAAAAGGYCSLHHWGGYEMCSKSKGGKGGLDTSVDCCCSASPSCPSVCNCVLHTGHCKLIHDMIQEPSTICLNYSRKLYRSTATAFLPSLKVKNEG